jgi:hypothetical protein
MNAQPIDFKDLENTYELRKQTYQIWCNPSDYQPPKKDIFWPIFGIICFGLLTFFLGALWGKYQLEETKDNSEVESLPEPNNIFE